MPVGRPRSPRLLVAACLVLVGGCTSSPPMPSSGTNASPPPTPNGSVIAPTGSGAPTGAPSAPPATASAPGTSGPTPTPTAPPTPVPTPAPTLPPPAAIAAELVTPGSLTVCLALIGPPAATLDRNDRSVGYNVAFASELASRLDLAPVIQETDFSALVTNIQSHTCDISVSSQNITAERGTQMNLVPYTQSKAGFPVVVAKGNPVSVASLTDLCGRPVSAATGSTNVDAVNGTGDFQGDGINFSCEQANAQALDLRLYPSELDAVQALLDNTVVAYLGNANFVAQYPRLLQGTTAMLPPARQGIAVALDHPQLTTAMSAALSDMISDGTYLQILSQYVPNQDDVDNISIIE